MFDLCEHSSDEMWRWFYVLIFFGGSEIFCSQLYPWQMSAKRFNPLLRAKIGGVD